MPDIASKRRLAVVGLDWIAKEGRDGLVDHAQAANPLPDKVFWLTSIVSRELEPGNQTLCKPIAWMESDPVGLVRTVRDSAAGHQFLEEAITANNVFVLDAAAKDLVARCIDSINQVSSIAKPIDFNGRPQAIVASLGGCRR